MINHGYFTDLHMQFNRRNKYLKFASICRIAAKLRKFFLYEPQKYEEGGHLSPPRISPSKSLYWGEGVSDVPGICRVINDG